METLESRALALLRRLVEAETSPDCPELTEEITAEARDLLREAERVSLAVGETPAPGVIARSDGRPLGPEDVGRVVGTVAVGDGWRAVALGRYLGVQESEWDGGPVHMFEGGEINGTPQDGLWGHPVADGRGRAVAWDAVLAGRPGVTDREVAVGAVDRSAGRPWELACDECYGTDGPFYALLGSESVVCAACRAAILAE